MGGQAGKTADVYVRFFYFSSQLLVQCYCVYI